MSQSEKEARPSPCKASAKGSRSGTKLYTREKSQRSFNDPCYEPGLSKIKCAMRQTARLLAKDNLAQDVRQEAMRRLESLQADLARREFSTKERKNAERYHKVRFFERQKLVRQIRKIKRRIDESDGEGAGTLQKELHEKRVLLHYVLTFPASLKYVALFPTNGESPFTKPAEMREETERSRRAKATYQQAVSVRERVRAAMASGELSKEPEVLLESGVARSPLTLQGEGGPQNVSADNVKKSSRSKAPQSNKSNCGKRAELSVNQSVENDDFFASGDDDDD